MILATTSNSPEMTKRPAEDVTDGQDAYLKRQKLSVTTHQDHNEEIKSANQLRQLLAFQQNAAQLKHAIQSLKLFLDNFTTNANENDRRTAILKEYLESQIPVDRDVENPPVLLDILKAWEFAAQSSNDSLMSAVPAVLALLLKTISSTLELSKYGLRLGKTLLQKPQLELIGRGLLASKNKDFVISPALRLLRELTIFDGGVHAKYVFRAREFTFKGLGRNLNLKFTGTGVENPRKPSVRTNALRFLLPLFKFLSVEAKRELLSQRDVTPAITRDIRDDPPFIVRDILNTLKTHIMLDDLLPRDAKTKIINVTTLVRIAALYQYDQVEEEEGVGHEEAQVKKPIDDTAHDFLITACTSLNMGVLVRQTGFYPRGIDPDDIFNVEGNNDFIDLGLDSIEWMSKFTDNIPVRNTILSEFSRNLRPWSSLKQSELLISMFKAAPELVADYFFSKKDFSFDPRLTGTWMGYSAFIFAALKQPVPQFFGHQDGFGRLPPPTSIVLENILPRQLNQKVLTRCLNHAENPLITFFVVRILCVALQKLQSVLQMYQQASSSSLPVIWGQAAVRVAESFCLRCPAISHVISAYRRLSKNDLVQREAITKLLVLYYEIVPQVAMEANSGAPAAISEFLQSSDTLRFGSEDGALRALELENLFTFAHSSPGVKWCSKSKGLSISPFMAMVRLSAEAPTELPLLRLRSVLLSVVEENQIFQTQTTELALDIFILCFKNAKPNSDILYEFLDDCISRCASTPAKYIFALEQIYAELEAEIDDFGPVSLVLLTIREQWPFQINSSSSSTVTEEKANFIAQYLAASINIGENEEVLKFLIKSFATETPAESLSRKIIEASLDLIGKASDPDSNPASAIRGLDKKAGTKQETTLDLGAMIDVSASPPEDHSFLVKWMNKEVDEVIEDGYAASLIVLLSSNHLSVRKEALTNLSKLAMKLKESSFEEKDQVWLLLSELNETARSVVDGQELPAVISTFASHAIQVLRDPLHCLFPKINKFLSQGPTWQIDKVPLLHRILDEAPTIDDAGNLERKWLFEYMLDGLRSKVDLDIYRKRLVFEKLLSNYNVHLGKGLQEQILKIIAKASLIEGGSTTLITRFSALTWLQVQEALNGGSHLKSLDKQILASCDQRRVRAWSKSTLLTE